MYSTARCLSSVSHLCKGAARPSHGNSILGKINMKQGSRRIPMNQGEYLKMCHVLQHLHDIKTSQIIDIKLYFHACNVQQHFIIAFYDCFLKIIEMIERRNRASFPAYSGLFDLKLSYIYLWLHSV